MCSGRVDLEFILRAFSNGQDGVFVGGCRLGECNYITHGNFHALNTVTLAKKIMEHIGLNPDRLRIEFMSSGDGIRYSEVVDDFTFAVRKLGPLGQSDEADPAEIKARLDEVRKLIPYIKLTKKDKLAHQFATPAEYEDLYTAEEIDELFSQVISYYIDPAKCQACMICARRCPVKAIDGAKGRVHIIDQDKCIKCGSCFQACPPKFGAIQQLVGQPAPPPIPEAERAVVR